MLKTSKPSMQCKDCDRWENIEVPGHEITIEENRLSEGVCRAHSPQVIVMAKPNPLSRQLDMGFMSVWPQVAGECPCCGDFVERKEGE